MSFICFNVIVYLLINSEISKIKLNSFFPACFTLCQQISFSVGFLLFFLFSFFLCVALSYKKHIAKLQNCSHCCLSSDVLNQWFVGNCSFICFGDFHFLSLLISGAYKCVQIDYIIGVLAGLLFVIQMRAKLQMRMFRLILHAVFGAGE